MKQNIESSWRELSSYLDEMLDLEGDARERWLQALEVSQPEIGGRLRSQLQELVALDAADFLRASDVNPYASLGGQRFGAYTLDRQLGQGGMGSVWLAHRSDGRFTGQAAVKLLSPMLVGHPTERRFVREGSVLARLQHPNIARLLDAGVAGGHQPYLVLEYVPGEHIDRHCDRLLLDVSARIRLFLNVLDAVAHAHSNLIVHRDLKPSNILVTQEGVVKLLDFGVAALLSPLEECLTQLAQAGHTLGYAAPEQIRGETVTTATDVYSLGVVLFLLLTGQHPHLPECKNAPELMKAILESEPHRPSEVAADPRLARELRGDLDNIVRKALSRERADRYATVTQFAEDLRRYLALEPVSARPRSIGYLATMFVRRHRASVALAVGIVAILICAVAVTTTEMLEARKQRAEAARQRDQARFETRHAEASHDFLQLLMTADLGTKKPLSTFHDRLEYGVSLLDTQYREDPKFAGRMLVQLATFYRDNEETGRANELYEKAYQLGRANHDPSLMASAQCYRAFGDAYADNRAGLAERLEEAQRLTAQLHDPDVDLEVACLQARARMEIQLGHRDAAEPLLRQALRIMEEDEGTYTQTYNSLLTELSQIYLDRNQLKEPLRLTLLAGEQHDRAGRGGTPSRLIVRENAATLLGAMGEARASLAENVVLIERVKEVESPGQEPLAYPINYARALLRRAKPKEALPVIEGVLERTRSSGNARILSYALLTQGSIFVQLGHWPEADAALTESAALVAGGLGNKSLAAEIESQRALVDLNRGDPGSAQRRIDSALEMAGYGTHTTERSLYKVLMLASRVALAEHDPQRAERFARDAVPITESQARGPDTSADTGEALMRVAEARLAMVPGQQADVRPLLERAMRCLTNALTPDHPMVVQARALLASTQPPAR